MLQDSTAISENRSVITKGCVTISEVNMSVRKQIVISKVYGLLPALEV